MAPPRDDETDVPGGREALDLPVARVMSRDRRRGRSLETLVALVVVGVAIAVLKPWTGVGDGLPLRSGVTALAAGPDAATPAPTPTEDPSRARAAELCLAPSGWRMFSTERWSDRLVRSWVGIVPLVDASGPGDPRIPFVDESSMAVLNMGYCAPLSGSERPASGATATIFQLKDPSPPAGRATASDWEQIRPGRVLPVAGASPFGGAWAPPGGAGAVTWPSGWYVFAIGDRAALSTAVEHWFGVHIEIRPPPPD